MCATRTQATALAMVVSKSLASLRHRPSQANVRSTTHQAGQYFKPFGLIGPLDDRDGPFADFIERIAELVAGIAAVGEDVPQPGVKKADRRQDTDGAVPILDVGGMNLADRPDDLPYR